MIKMPPECRESDERAMRALATAFYGVYHVDGWPRRRPAGTGVRVVLWGPMSTYDFATLTRLVVACHDECVRLELKGCGPGYIEALFHARKRDSESFYERHPTIEQAVDAVRAFCRENRLVGEEKR